MRAGHDVWVWDNLSRGHRGAVPDGRLIEGELADRPRLEQALRAHRIEAVMHFAAFALVGESVADPARVLLQQRRVHAGLARRDAQRRRPADRVFQHDGHLRRSATDSDHRGGDTSSRSIRTDSPSW